MHLPVQCKSILFGPKFVMYQCKSLQTQSDKLKAMRVSTPFYQLYTLGLMLSVLITFGGAGMLYAQKNPQPYFRNYSTEQGLSSPETYCIMQDSKGYMWFGTDNGAARFDGYTFQTYGAKQGLTSNVVFDIHEDAKGRIWFGTMTGEAFILEGDTVVPYRFNHLVEQYRGQFKHAGLVYLQADTETTWFELINLGFLKIDSVGNRELITSERSWARIILEIDGYEQGLRTSVAKRDQEIKNQSWREYELTNKVALLEGITPKNKFQIELPHYIYSDCTVEFKAQRLLDKGWLIGNCNRLFYLKEDKIAWSIPFTFRFNEIIQHVDGAIWICGAQGGGLRRYADLDALKKNQYSQFLEGLSVSYLSQNARGGFWVSTIEQGIFYCSDVELLIYDSRFGFSNDFVTGIAFKNEHELFAGLKHGDIFEVNLAENQITNKLVSYGSGANNQLFYDLDNRILWSSAGYWKNSQWNFLKARHLITRKWYEFKSILGKLHFNSKGHLVGCYHHGFYIFDITQDTALVDPFNYNLRGRAYAVYTDCQERLWVGNPHGIFEFKDSSLLSPNIHHPAFHSRVEDIDGFPDSSLVFGTKGWGVIRWKDEHNEEILNITEDEGLTSNMVEDVHVDEKGILWVATLNGLNKITFDVSGKPVVRQFTMANGLPTNEITKIRSNEGQVWLCSPKGLIRFHELPEQTTSISPIMQVIMINGRAVSVGANPEFPADQNNLEFRFLTINYHQNGRIPYRYRLDKDAPWQYTHNLSVNYPQLPSGAYRFEVQSQNQDGYWSKSTTQTFEINPPWWTTGWARATFLGLFLTTLMLYQRQYTKKIRKETAIQQQITDLERSALQAQMNPHFIFNCLNSIQNFILQNDRKLAVEYLARFAQLVRHNLNASVEGSVSLEEEISLLDNYLALERQRLDQGFDYAFEIDPELDNQVICIPPLLIQPYVENAIIHGLSAKKREGQVIIRFKKENEYLRVIIRDNGNGLAVKEINKKTHKSMGMTITQKRLELLSNQNKKLVRIKTYTEPNFESGTEVNILIKLNQS